MAHVRKKRPIIGVLVVMLICLIVLIVWWQTIGNPDLINEQHVKVTSFWELPIPVVEPEIELEIEEELPTEPVMHDWLIPYLEQNEELVGWIVVHGTNIDFPVYQNMEITEYWLSDWNFYLRHNRNRIRDGIGEIYLWPSELSVPEKDLFFVFGHNFADNQTQFSQLENYWFDVDFRQDLEIRFFTLYEEFVYEIIWAVMAENWTNASGEVIVKFVDQNTALRSDNLFIYHELVRWEDDAQFNEFVKLMNEYALMPYQGELVIDDQFIFLLTCESNRVSDRRRVLVGRRR